jgi:hypothetical protein
MLLLAFTFLYTGLQLNILSAVYATCLGFTQRSDHRGDRLEERMKEAAIIVLSGKTNLSNTVKKLRSRNLLFSCMFHIERKTVHDGAEKIITLY